MLLERSGEQQTHRERESSPDEQPARRKPHDFKALSTALLRSPSTSSSSVSCSDFTRVSSHFSPFLPCPNQQAQSHHIQSFASLFSPLTAAEAWCGFGQFRVQSAGRKATAASLSHARRRVFDWVPLRSLPHPQQLLLSTCSVSGRRGKSSRCPLPFDIRAAVITLAVQ